MGGWKGPGQRRGREGPEERRRAAERGGGGGGGGIPALLGPAREPFPPSCLLLPPPRGAAMTVSASPGQPFCAPGREESDGPSQSRAAPLLDTPFTSRRREEVSAGRQGDPGGTGRPDGLSLPQPPHLPGARSRGDPEKMGTPCPGQPLPPTTRNFCGTSHGQFRMALSHLPSSPPGNSPKLPDL